MATNRKSTKNLAALVGGFRAEQAIETRIQVRVSHNGEVIRSGTGNIAVPVPGSIIVAFPNVLLKDVKEVGLLEFQMKLQDGEWQTVRKLQLTTKSSANASQLLDEQSQTASS